MTEGEEKGVILCFFADLNWSWIVLRCDEHALRSSKDEGAATSKDLSQDLDQEPNECMYLPSFFSSIFQGVKSLLILY